MLREVDIERFKSKVKQGPHEACWTWTGGHTPYGYGAFWIGTSSAGRNHGTHRIAWMIANGKDIPAGMVICHTCDNPACVNPSHLFLGTKGDNNRDALLKGRHARIGNYREAAMKALPRGIQHWNADKTADNVREIRRLAANGMSHRAISKQFNCNQTGVSRIVRRESWTHIE